MKLQQDPLFEIFKRHMDQALMQDESSEDQLVSDVVKEYMELLNKRGFVPSRLFKYLEHDVREDVTQMLKKTTYGYFNLKSYQQNHKNILISRSRDC